MEATERRNCKDIKFNFTAEILDLCLYGKKTTYDTILAAPPGVCLPHGLHLGVTSLPGGGAGVYSDVWVATGTLVGRFQGGFRAQTQLQSGTDNGAMWEVQNKSGRVDFYIDGSNCSSWMVYVQCARTYEEQNLELIQLGNELHYRTIKSVAPRQELFVWYSDAYNLFMGIPDWNFPLASKIQTEANHSALNKHSNEEEKKTSCIVCHRIFNSKSNLRSHMRIHTLERPFRCRECQKSFSQSSTLRNHTRLHTGERPYACADCKRAYSQLAGLRAHQKSARHRFRQHLPEASM